MKEINKFICQILVFLHYFDQVKDGESLMLLCF